MSIKYIDKPNKIGTSIYKHVLLCSTSRKYMKLTFNNHIWILSNKYKYLRY